MNIQAPPPRGSEAAPMRLVYPTDTVGKAIIYSLEQPLEQPRVGAFARAIGQQGPEIGWLLWIVLFAFIALLISIFTDNGSAKTWAVAFAVDSVVGQTFLLFLIWYARHIARRFPYGVKAAGEVSVRSLRQAALAGNDELAPVVTPPADDEAFEIPTRTTSAETLAVLPPEWRLLRGMKILSGMCIGMSVFLGVVQWTIDKNASPLPWGVLIIAPFGITLGLWVLFYYIRHSRAFRVTVSADGLRWRKHSLPWSEVRGWNVLNLHLLNTSWTHPNTVYVLTGQHTNLTWLTYPQSVDSDDPGKRLAQLVQAHLLAHGPETPPLRDLTPGAVTISYEVGTPLLGWRIWRLLAANSHSLSGASLPRLPAALATFFLAALALLGVIFTPNAQQWYFGRQLMQLENSSTALRDSMTADTLHWTTAPVYGNHRTFTFTPHGYTYPTEDCCGASSYISRPVGDGLVEVTMTVQPKDNYDWDRAGIIVRANSQAKTALVFSVTPDGFWELGRFTMGAEGLLNDGKSLQSGGGTGSVHLRHDVTNRLAVLMQGWSYTLFINGQFVGRYWGSDLPQSGQVGVYAEAMDGQVIFSDLLIAPA